MEKETTMMKWLLGGKIDSRREFAFMPWENEGIGLDGVKCILTVSRGSTVENSKRPYETKSAVGTGITMEEAFNNAYDDLVGWLV